ncbi:MAG: 50S ribosomal protein L11 methyltransferase [Lachnospiraceae bacterium]|nr:50S ribosomal protein L11 methyltransferase [Lachnospiraceae bacterium]
MKWNKYSFITRSDSVDILSALLCDVGIEGIEVEDHKALSQEDTKGMFIDILPDLGPDDGTAKVSFYLDPDDPELERKLADAVETLDQFGNGAELVSGQTEDIDWINNWKEFFHPLSVGNILVKPTWEDVPVEDKDKILIEIDPGTAFGTGGHETTQLCMIQLEKYIKAGDEVCDLGTGSGILGIAALKLGAGHVVGTDLDDNAIDAVGENCIQNNIEIGRAFEVICGNVIDDRSVQDRIGYEKYDIVVANILAPVIIMLVDEVARHMKKGALFITSGIIDTKEAEVTEAFRRNPEFEITEINHLGEWVNITARKR